VRVCVRVCVCACACVCACMRACARVSTITKQFINYKFVTICPDLK